MKACGHKSRDIDGVSATRAGSSVGRASPLQGADPCVSTLENKGSNEAAEGACQKRVSGQGSILFTCPRITQTVRLTPRSCGKRWRVANGKGPRKARGNAELLPVIDMSQCRRCPVGAEHSKGMR